MDEDGIALSTPNATAPRVRETPASGVRRRAELADFLRMRRASLQPEDVGLQAGGRRRTPGLRREEVAQLAGVGTTWYTWLEQGRDVRASLDVLEAIARALRLSQAERTHLILLGRGEQPPPCKSPAERVSPALRKLIENLGPNPAYILGRRWDYLAWNDAAVALLGDLGKIPRAVRNHAWLTFTDPARREMFTDWERSSRLLVAKFRADSARHLGDPEFEQLIAALARVEPRVLPGLEAPRGGPRRRGPQGPAPPARRDALVLARGLQPGRGIRAAPRPLLAAAGERNRREARAADEREGRAGGAPRAQGPGRARHRRLGRLTRSRKPPVVRSVSPPGPRLSSRGAA